MYDLEFSPDGQILASASGDRTVKLWNVASGERLDTLGQSLLELYAVAFSPDGKRVAAGGVDNRIRIWEIGPGAKEGTNPLLHARYAHEGAVLRLAYTPDGKYLVSTAENRSVKVWKADTCVEQQLLEQQSDWPVALAMAPDSQSLVVARLDGTVARYRAETGEVLPPQPLPVPSLASVTPRGIERGRTARITLRGEHLARTDAVKCAEPRVHVAISADAARGEGELTVDVTAPGDLPRGAIQLSVAGPGGESNQLTLHVDDLPQQTEEETAALRSLEHLTALPLGVWGAIAAPGDEDDYTFDASAGDMIVFDLAAKQLGSELNAVLTVADDAGRLVASRNDFDGEPDPLFAYQAERAGRYRVSVKDLAAAGSEKHFYRLTVGKLPYVTGCYPLSVPANATTRVALLGHNLPEGASVEVAAGAMGEAPIAFDTSMFRARRELKVAIGELPESL